MEHSTFQGELISLGTDAADSKEEPPDLWVRLTKVFMMGKETAQQKAVFQVLISDGCLFYGNYPLRHRGGCCICLLMASGLIAKRLSIWVADANEGEVTYTTFSKRLKLAVLILLPRLVYTSHPCSQSKMDNRHGGHEKTIKDFLTFAVRLLSRILVGKTNGQEICWKYPPLDWPENILGPWKNPTSSPKDNTETLQTKYKYLRIQVSNEKIEPEELKAFEDFEQGNIDSVKSFMSYNTLTDKINNIKDQLADMQEPHLMLLEEKLKLAIDQVSSLLSSPVASTSRSTTATETSSLSTLSRKRKSNSPISVQSKKPKPEMPNSGICFQDNSIRQKEIKPKPTQISSSDFLTVFTQNKGTPKSTTVESPLGYTAFPYQLSSLVSSKSTLSNTCINTSKCAVSSHHTEAAAALKIQPSIVPSSILIICTNSVPGSSLEELPRTVSHCGPTLSADSGTWSQESNVVKETFIELDQEKLNDKSVQDDLQMIQNSQNNFGPLNFDPKIFINFKDK